jgi:hypothetical protein
MKKIEYRVLVNGHEMYKRIMKQRYCVCILNYVGNVRRVQLYQCMLMVYWQ